MYNGALAQIAKTLGSTLIRYRSDAKVSDRYLIDVDPENLCHLGGGFSRVGTHLATRMCTCPRFVNIERITAPHCFTSDERSLRNDSESVSWLILTIAYQNNLDEFDDEVKPVRIFITYVFLWWWWCEVVYIVWFIRWTHCLNIYIYMYIYIHTYIYIIYSCATNKGVSLTPAVGVQRVHVSTIYVYIFQLSDFCKNSWNNLSIVVNCIDFYFRKFIFNILYGSTLKIT